MVCQPNNWQIFQSVFLNKFSRCEYVVKCHFSYLHCIVLKLAIAFMFMMAWVFDAHLCLTVSNEIKKTNVITTLDPKLV